MQSPERLLLKAVFGGTFDPPHHGHMQPLLAVLESLDMQSCELIPSHIPVHKQACSSAQHRLNMTQIFARQDSRLLVNKIEVMRDSPSYSVDTVCALSEQHPEHAICFIMGLDAFLGLASWHLPHTLMQKCHIVVMMRGEATYPLADDNTQQRLIRFLESYHKANIPREILPSISDDLRHLLPEQLYLVDKMTQNAQNQRINGILRASKQGEVVFVLNPQTEISSTMIRRAIADGVSTEQWLTPDIIEYIQAHRIYS
ncbi:nicotinate (nicotinamide) nucleotide adenylyltransferase [Glaciecola sp. SC05]|uniref:nicotinate (nicotinamide) nucleotide adenylyltransferase n=1 Tax=Glaciecola sp. SC05 TaxID=1987355 RepID=UPI003529521F